MNSNSKSADVLIILANAELLLGINLLEYHDKNFLANSNKQRMEDQREVIQKIIDAARRLQK